MTAPDGSDAAISGVPLAQYAAVTAALAEAYPLKAVLTVEGLDSARWAKADSGWTARLADDSALLARYEVLLSVATDRLGRTVEPIDTDLGAWIAFLAALAREPDALLHDHGIIADDVARLRRHWDVRMMEDPALRKRAADLQRSPGELPPLRVVKAKLTRSGTGLSPEGVLASAAAESARAARVPVRPVAAPAAPRKPQNLGDSVTTIAAGPSVPLPFRAAVSREFQEALERPAAGPGDGSDGETVDIFIGGMPKLDETVAFPSDAPASLGTTLPFHDGRGHASPLAARTPRKADPPPSVIHMPAGTLPKLFEETTSDSVATVPLEVPVPEKLPFDIPRRSISKLEQPGGQVDAAPQSSHALSLDRHAALCLEIAVDPAHADDALARYGVSAVDKARLDDLYRARMTAEPALRVQWNNAFEAHRARFVPRSR